MAQNGARLQRWARRLCTRFGLILFQQKGVTENRTSIMIAHRLSTIIDADKILVSAQTWPRERWTMGVRAPHRQLRCTACHPQALSVFLPAPVPGAPGRADRRTGDSRGTPRRQRALLESVEEPDRCQLHGVNRHMWVWCVCVRAHLLLLLLLFIKVKPTKTSLALQPSSTVELIGAAHAAARMCIRQSLAPRAYAGCPHDCA